ncbi:alpha/beta hydrolase [Ottowia sp. GY511]|uniref:Alpha/beta fold hydrolase n=1 Tax=Ottowia flava TaxID=2675430 RepID=A0ABW4KP31_9BURK|nr:alpha/beta fold hydrolase [Ottowia sp. GY511]TXK28326.1 alpha/beta hydrolase [Ottowia sp. GY511]
MLFAQPHHHLLPRLAHLSRLALLPLVAALTACGGGDDEAPDPLASYRTQTLDWAACDPAILGEAISNQTRAAFEQLQPSERLRCAKLRAPLDWSQPGRGDVSVALMRLASAEPAQRRGALLFNPGGPGTDGLSLALRLFAAFGISDAQTPQGALQLRLLNAYDMVGFSPRGVGASTRLSCDSDAMAQPVDETVSGWSTPDNLKTLDHNRAQLAEACRKNPLTPYINSDATARDMELMRVVLGEDKLNYLGYSYGTWLGAWYASLFPEKVGRMVLDSAVNFSLSFEAGVELPQPAARARLFDEVLAPYAARHSERFQLGASADQVRAAVPALSERMQPVMGRVLSHLGYGSSNADAYLDAMAAGQGLNAVLKALGDPIDEDAAEAALDAQVYDPLDPRRDALLRDYVAETLLPLYAALWLEPQPNAIALAGATGQAVRCNDTPVTTDWASWSPVVRSAAAAAPLFFSTLLDSRVCAFWGGPSVQKPDWTPMKALDILYVQSEFDSATATPSATAFFNQLPGARRVYVPGEYQHGVYPYTDDCVDPTVSRYLLGETPTQRETVCSAKPLALDAPQVAKAHRASAYLDPAAAAELIDAFKRGLIPARRLPGAGH